MELGMVAKKIVLIFRLKKTKRGGAGGGGGGVRKKNIVINVLKMSNICIYQLPTIKKNSAQFLCLED